MKAKVSKDGSTVTLKLGRDEFYDLDRIISNLTPKGVGCCNYSETDDERFIKAEVLMFRADVYSFLCVFESLFKDKANRLLP